MARQMVLFEAREMRPNVKAFVRGRLAGLELRQAVRVERRRRNLRRRLILSGGFAEAARG